MVSHHFLIRYLCFRFVEFDNITFFSPLFHFKTAKKNLKSHTVCLSRFFDSIDISTISSDILSGKAGLRRTLKSAAQAFLYV